MTDKLFKKQNFTVCKRCGKIQVELACALYADIRNGDKVKLNMCDDCKFSLRNLWRAFTKKEESKDE